jgi:hypothetical protein
MFWLPKELQDYIYSYDDNTYYKRLYGQSLSQILHLYKRSQSILTITHIHQNYQIFIEQYKPFYRNTNIPRKRLSLKEYIVKRNKDYEPPIWSIGYVSSYNHLLLLEG